MFYTTNPEKLLSKIHKRVQDEIDDYSDSISLTKSSLVHKNPQLHKVYKVKFTVEIIEEEIIPDLYKSRFEKICELRSDLASVNYTGSKHRISTSDFSVDILSEEEIRYPYVFLVKRSDGRSFRLGKFIELLNEYEISAGRMGDNDTTKDILIDVNSPRTKMASFFCKTDDGFTTLKLAVQDFKFSRLLKF